MYAYTLPSEDRLFRAPAILLQNFLEVIRRWRNDEEIRPAIAFLKIGTIPT